MNINKSYLEKVKQELVDVVAGTPHIVPELLILTTELPTPKVDVKYPSDKINRKIARRKNISSLWNDDNSIHAIKNYHESELLLFIENFPQFSEVIE